MFVFDRSAFAVLIPLGLLMAVVLYSSRPAEADPVPRAQAEAVQPDHTVAANLPSR